MMSNYKSGYDPKNGYNKNAFAHGTVGTAVMGQVVKLIATPIGLVSEAVHSRKSKSQSTSDVGATAAASSPRLSSKEGENEKRSSAAESQTDKEGPTHVEVPPEEAHQLIASGQAEPADGEAPTHELVSEHDRIERDEANWALDDAAAETEIPEPLPTEETTQKPKPSATST